MGIINIYIYMAFLRLQKRLAATVMKCGQKRVYIDPTEVNEVKLANSRKNIRKLVKDHIIEKRKTAVHSRFRVKAWHAAVRKGRHTGTGRRKGARNARMPSEVLWMRRSRVLRRLLRKYREAKKITPSQYRQMYLRAKGNMYKNKNNLIESIHKDKADKKREGGLEAQREARRAKNGVRKEKRAAKKLAVDNEETPTKK